MRKPLSLTVIALLSLPLVMQAQQPALQITSRVVATAPSPAEELQLSLGSSASGQPLDDPQCQVAWAGTPLCKTLELTLKNTGTHLLRVLNNGCTRQLIDIEEAKNGAWPAPAFKFSPTQCQGSGDSWTVLKPGEQMATRRQFHEIWKGGDVFAPGPHTFQVTQIVEYCADQPEGAATCSIPDPQTSSISVASTMLTSSSLMLEQPTTQALRAEAQISGRVVRADNGAPIQGATVELSAASNGVHRRLATTTDSRGEYSFLGVPDDYYIPVALADGFVTATHLGTASGGSDFNVVAGSTKVLPSTRIRDLNFKLMRGAVLRGTVTNTAGQPAGSGIPVIAEPTDRRPRDDSNSMEGKTDAQGMFALKGLAPGSYFVHVQQPLGGYANTSSANGWWYADTWYGDASAAKDATPLSLKLGEEQNIRIAAKQEKRYNVIVWMSGPEGFPVPQTRLDPEPYVVMLPGSNTTGDKQPDGSYRFRNVPSGHYILDSLAVSRAGIIGQAKTDFVVSDADTTLHVKVPAK